MSITRDFSHGLLTSIKKGDALSSRGLVFTIPRYSAALFMDRLLPTGGEELSAKNAQIRELPLFDKPDQETLDRIAAMEIPSKGRDPLVVGEELVNDVFEHAMLLQHPRFYSFVASAVSPYSLAGSILTDIYNIHAGGWELAPCAGLIEEKLVKWMGHCAGYTGENIGGVFLSGGSMANMSAMVAARDSRLAPEEK